MTDFRQNFKRNSGFTTVELCVTLAILAVLASIVTFSLIKWQAFSSERQRTENAQILMLAAQNRLSVLKSNNILDDYIISAGLSPINVNGRKVYYVSCMKGDYRLYEKDGSSSSALFQIVERYVSDKSILNASIVIEFDREEGKVLDVIYSDRIDSFSYSLKTSGNRVFNISERTDALSDNELIGFCGEVLQ